MMRRYIPTPDEIPSGICECGCGKPTPIARHTAKARRCFVGFPQPYCRGHSLAKKTFHPPLNTKHGAEHSAWKGGRTTNLGYVLIRTPGHPYGLKHKGYVPEQRLVMEAHLGRYLTATERVHHLNRDRADNRLENLVLTVNQAEHMRLHKEPKPSPSAETRRKLSETTRRAWAEGRMRPNHCITP